VSLSGDAFPSGFVAVMAVALAAAARQSEQS
jgi:hypothetical protein